MYVLLVTHRVEDFDRFKAAFDAHPPERGGAVSHSVHRIVDVPDRVTITARYEDLDQVEAWRSSPELPAAMADAGVVPPVIAEVLEEVERRA